jgi:peptidoglycan/xylan/chitin deacetylase (PgdA/CDA1 family)
MFDKADAIRRIIMSAASATGLDALARPLLGGVGVILMLHHVTARPPSRADSPNRHLAVTPDFLDAALAAIRADGFAFVCMDEAVERLRSGGGGGRFAAVTADDGYRDNLLEALPVLERHGAPITVYVAPGLTDGNVPLWWDAIEDIAFGGRAIELPDGETLDCSAAPQAAFARLLKLFTRDAEEARQTAVLKGLSRQAGMDPLRTARADLMDWSELRALAAHPLATVGAHTVRHANLKRLAPEDARREIEESRARLEAELGSTPRHFAFPYGSADAAGAREVALVREAGFASAVTTRHGVLHAAHAAHLHALPRISLNGRFQSVAQTRVMTRGFTAPLANRGRSMVTV